jgi:hypothetical protein
LDGSEKSINDDGSEKKQPLSMKRLDSRPRTESGGEKFSSCRRRPKESINLWLWLFETQLNNCMIIPK